MSHRRCYPVAAATNGASQHHSHAPVASPPCFTHPLRLPICESQSDAEAAERRALVIQQQRLPEGVTAVPARRRFVGCCDVCGEETEYDDNLILECDGCRTQVSRDKFFMHIALPATHFLVANSAVGPLCMTARMKCTANLTKVDPAMSWSACL